MSLGEKSSQIPLFIISREENYFFNPIISSHYYFLNNLLITDWVVINRVNPKQLNFKWVWCGKGNLADHCVHSSFYSQNFSQEGRFLLMLTQPTKMLHEHRFTGGQNLDGKEGWDMSKSHYFSNKMREKRHFQANFPDHQGSAMAICLPIRLFYPRSLIRNCFHLHGMLPGFFLTWSKVQLYDYKDHRFDLIPFTDCLPFVRCHIVFNSLLVPGNLFVSRTKQ